MKKINIDSVKPYENNAKKHPLAQLELLANIIKEVGWRQPVVVNQYGVIVVGHGRWATWEKYKQDLKPIWIIDDTGKTIHGSPETIPLTEEQEKAYRLADNKANESDWDMKLVKLELEGLSNFDMAPLGFIQLSAPSIEFDTDTTEQDLDVFLNASIKQVVLSYDSKEFERLQTILGKLRQDLGVGDNSELFVKLIEFYENNRSK
jgi:hypothetical protein